MSDENKVEESVVEDKKSGGIFGFGADKKEEEVVEEPKVEEAPASEEEAPAPEKKAKEKPAKKAKAAKKEEKPVARTDEKKEMKVGTEAQKVDLPKVAEKEKPASMAAFVASKKGAWKTLDPLKKNKWTWTNPGANIIGAMARECMGWGLAGEKASKADVMKALAAEIYSQMTAKEESKTDSE